MNSNNKLVVVTGGSSGIGKAIVSEFSKKGYSVLVLDRSGGSEDFKSNPNFMSRKLDVTDLKGFEQVIAEAEEKFGPVQGIVNNAGVMLLSEVDVQNPDEWEKTLNVNVMGVFNGTKAVLKGMKARGSGTIINISSIAGFRAFPNHAVYGASKYAVHGFTENLRQEIAPYGLRSILISPGVVETALLSHTSSQTIKESYTDWKKSIGGAINPEDIAGAVVFAYEQPKNVCIREIVIAPTSQVQ